MSWQAVDRARRHRVGKPAWKAVLLVVADSCNPDGHGCTARYQTIARDAECGLATVKRAIPAMLAAGVLHGRSGALSVEMDTPIDMTQSITTTPKKAQSDTTSEEAPVSESDQSVSERARDGIRVTPPSEPTNNRPSTEHKRKPQTSTAPDIWPVTDELRSWASINAPDVDLAVETANWLDHHRAKGSRFSDWTAAWRTWMRNAQRWLRKPKAASGPRAPIHHDRATPTGRLAL